MNVKEYFGAAYWFIRRMEDHARLKGLCIICTIICDTSDFHLISWFCTPSVLILCSITVIHETTPSYIDFHSLDGVYSKFSRRQVSFIFRNRAASPSVCVGSRNSFYRLLFRSSTFLSETCRANLWSWHLARIAKSNFVAFLPPKQWEPPTCHCPRTTSMYLAWIERFYFEWFDFAFLFEVPLKSPNSQSWWLPDHLSLDWILDFGLNCKFDYHYQYRLKT